MKRQTYEYAKRIDARIEALKKRKEALLTALADLEAKKNPDIDDVTALVTLMVEVMKIEGDKGTIHEFVLDQVMQIESWIKDLFKEFEEL